MELVGSGISVTRVGFLGNTFGELKADSFVNSSDYFTLSLGLGGDYSNTTENGAFYVDLSNGDRMWVNSQNTPGSNFNFSDMPNQLGRYPGVGTYRQNMTSVFWGFGTSIARVIQTANYDAGLADIFNKKRCK